MLVVSLPARIVNVYAAATAEASSAPAKLAASAIIMVSGPCSPSRACSRSSQAVGQLIPNLEHAQPTNDGADGLTTSKRTRYCKRARRTDRCGRCPHPITTLLTRSERNETKDIVFVLSQFWRHLSVPGKPMFVKTVLSYLLACTQLWEG